ncbi:transposase [Streptomyces sp. NPDC005548]|uniref:transposase n=1 Tax=Streptomyces sp. NPDC005548 TaxID=3364724 RepID=UPI00367E7CD8
MAWVIDDVSMPKDGRMSVAPQYCGALGKRANCQAAVSVHAASDSALPFAVEVVPAEDWAADSHRRTRTLIPPEITHREKWRPALDLLDSLVDWGMTPLVVADAAYGTNAHLRAALSKRGLTYVQSIRSDVSAHPFDT